jgi:hypothetical protein
MPGTLPHSAISPSQPLQPEPVRVINGQPSVRRWRAAGAAASLKRSARSPLRLLATGACRWSSVGRKPPTMPVPARIWPFAGTGAARQLRVPLGRLSRVPRVSGSSSAYRRRVDVLLRGGPGEGQVAPGGGEAVVWRACLYEITTEYGHQHGRGLRVYRHRPDCCEPYGRGDEDRCE